MKPAATASREKEGEACAAQPAAQPTMPRALRGAALPAEARKGQVLLKMRREIVAAVLHENATRGWNKSSRMHSHRFKDGYNYR